MSPDLYFALTLIVKMAVTAGFLLAATVTAERAGPLIGGLVATLPISAGPVYIFLALDHDAHFIAQSALGSLVTNSFNVVFALTYALLAQKRSLAVSLGGAFAAWFALIWASGFVAWTLAARDPAQRRHHCRLLLAVGALAPCADAARAHGAGTTSCCAPAMVALLVGIVVTLSFRIGPTASGNLAVFPIVLTSIMIILHRRVGGPATAAVMANAVIGLGGFAIAVIVLNLTADRLGSPLALVADACGVARLQSAAVFRAPARHGEMTHGAELISLLGLLLKIAMTASIVVAASVVVERSGPFVGALIASLPTAGGAAMIILAFEHPPAFIAQSAVGSMVPNAVCAVFALTYAALAQRRSLSVSLGGAFLVWLACAALSRLVDWTRGRAPSLLNAVVFPLAICRRPRFRAEGAVKRVALHRRRSRLARRRGDALRHRRHRRVELRSARTSPACSPSSRWRWARSSSSCIRASAARRPRASPRMCRRR